jgi:hypothetical protein
MNTMHESMNKRSSLVRVQMNLWKKHRLITRRENSWINSDHQTTGISLKIAKKKKKFSMY